MANGPREIWQASCLKWQIAAGKREKQAENKERLWYDENATRPPAVDREKSFYEKHDEQPSHLFSRKYKIAVKHMNTVACLLRRDIAKYCNSLMIL